MEKGPASGLFRRGWLSVKLSNAPKPVFSAYCIIAAFGTYFCMYGFRKPFAAATYEDLEWMGLGLKTILVASQTLGYMSSKFIGVKVVSEMSPRYRAVSIVGLIGIAEAALFLFGITPAPWNAFWLFVNGLPLGMVFGLVIGFLEGRRVTEALSAGLCASFILASGFVKSVGGSLIVNHQVSPFWMPFCTGLLFILPTFLFVWMLSQIPEPSATDEEARSTRRPMHRQQRGAFFRRHAFGLVGLLAMYMLLTLVRGIRDDFAVEIWRDLGVEDEPEVFAKSEFWVAVAVISVSGLAILIKDNRKAFLVSIALLGAGFLTVMVSIFSFQVGALSPMGFMVLMGFGMYVPYVAFHTTVFERMIAAFRDVGTIGYLLCLADGLGYLAYVAVMVFRNIASAEIDYLDLLLWISGIVSVVSLLATLGLGIYYQRTIPATIQSGPLQH